VVEKEDGVDVVSELQVVGRLVLVDRAPARGAHGPFGASGFRDRRRSKYEGKHRDVMEVAAQQWVYNCLVLRIVSTIV
jgi:hypothetical protein